MHRNRGIPHRAGHDRRRDMERGSNTYEYGGFKKSMTLGGKDVADSVLQRHHKDFFNPPTLESKASEFTFA